MIAQAHKTGDVLRNPVRLKEMSFDQRNEIAQFLRLNGLVGTVLEARGIRPAAILRQKIDFITMDAVAKEGTKLDGLTHADLRRPADILPPEFHKLGALVNWAEIGGTFPAIDSSDPVYFHILRAADTPDAELVNMLLAKLAPKDIRQVFNWHKDLSTRPTRAGLRQRRLIWWIFSQRSILWEKTGVRDGFLGHEPPLEVPPLPRRETPPCPFGWQCQAPGGAVKRR
ncbi:DUF6638 family protein [uncultured Sulfitobacter sp.]|uniref:DUF6638 family protein n=1 Tax=uncultured Sulfitobacter sp. TaxID=191468 RepID=UPI00261F7D36|nr:DUF6638 family protein [uncultured Sulfitobacter sp.]